MMSHKNDPAVHCPSVATLHKALCGPCSLFVSCVSPLRAPSSRSSRFGHHREISSRHRSMDRRRRYQSAAAATVPYLQPGLQVWSLFLSSFHSYLSFLSYLSLLANNTHTHTPDKELPVCRQPARQEQRL